MLEIEKALIPIQQNSPYLIFGYDANENLQLLHVLRVKLTILIEARPR